jgi:hypothetical protein
VVSLLHGSINGSGRAASSYRLPTNVNGRFNLSTQIDAIYVKDLLFI